MGVEIVIFKSDGYRDKKDVWIVMGTHLIYVKENQRKKVSYLLEGPHSDKYLSLSVYHYWLRQR